MAGVIVQPGTGLQGPVGPTGPTGATGPAGPAGGAVASAAEVEVTVTTGQTVLAYTPTTSGPFLIGLYLRVITAATTVSAVVTYTDATGAQSKTLQASGSLAVGSYPLDSITIDAVAGDAISVVVTAGTIDQVYASAAIWGTASGTGGGLEAPGFVQQATMPTPYGQTQNPTLTLATAPVQGHSLLLGLNFVGRGATSITQTGVTWTQAASYESAGGSYYQVWVGIVGASAGTLITINTASSNYVAAMAIEVTNPLTPTIGATYSAATSAAIGPLNATAGSVVAMLQGADATTDSVQTIPGIPFASCPVQVGINFAVGIAPSGPVTLHQLAASAPGGTVMVALS